MTLTYPVVPMTDGHPVVSCEKVQLRAFLDDPERWQSRVGRVLEAGRRRWHGRAEWEACPALRRWNRIQLPQWPNGHPMPGAVVAAAAAGTRIPGTDLTDFATAIMLLSGCPAVVTGSPRTGRAVRPTVLNISLFAFPADDVVLAQDLVEVTIATAGVVTYRSATTLELGKSRPGNRTRRNPGRSTPAVEPEMSDPVGVRLDGIGS